MPTDPTTTQNISEQAREAASVRQRAIDAVVWAAPIVSFDAMREAFFRDAGAHYNDIVYWSSVADANLQFTTPNASSRYVYLNFNTADGPLVLEIPPAVGAGLFGSILDAWQVPIADVGPHGEDGGRGGRYVLLPPGERTTDIADAIAVPMPTYNGYILLRAIPEDATPAASGRALGLVHQLRIFSARDVDAPPPQRLIDMAGRLFDAIVRYDDTFFDRLARMLGEEPVQDRDAAMMRDLATLGIEKGATPRGDAALRALRTDAARAAHDELARAAADEGAVVWPGRQWRRPSAIGAATGFSFVTERGLDARARGITYFLACAPPARIGKASQYMFAYVDGAGRRLSGEHTYRLHVPANVPAKQFWAATVYEAATAGFLRDSPSVELSSYRELRANADGSFDLYFGPQPTPGHERNWAYTAPGTPWFTIFRLYGPSDDAVTGAWQLPDLELIS